MPPSPARNRGRCVVGDLGGTRIRLATVDPETGELGDLEVLPRANYRGVLDAVESYLGLVELEEIAEVCLAVAGPVAEDEVVLPNTDWSFRCSELGDALDTRLTVINDFTAQALAVERLAGDELEWLGPARPTRRGVEVVIGPGTGLGTAVRTTSGEIIPSEAGHVGVAPANEREIEILRVLLGHFGRVSMERVVSGPGLENLHWAGAVVRGARGPDTPPSATAAEISRLAENGDPAALESIRTFFDLLASFAGDMALANWATGGVYLSGGALRKLDAFFDREAFRARFENKGRFRAFCRSVPVALVLAEHPGLIGCCAALSFCPARAEARMADRNGR